MIVAIETVPVPRVPDAERIDVDALGYADDGITYVTARFGYMETPNILRRARLLDPSADRVPARSRRRLLLPLHASNSKRQAPDHESWRKHLFIATSSFTADAAQDFELPRDRTVIIGSRIQV